MLPGCFCARFRFSTAAARAVVAKAGAVLVAASVGFHTGRDASVVRLSVVEFAHAGVSLAALKGRAASRMRTSSLRRYLLPVRNRLQEILLSWLAPEDLLASPRHRSQKNLGQQAAGRGGASVPVIFQAFADAQTHFYVFFPS